MIFSAVLDEGSVCVKEQLGVVDGSAVAFVDAYRDDHVCLPAGFADAVCCGGRYCYGLVE